MNRPFFEASYIVPPSANHIYRRGRHGRVHTTDDYSNWRKAARAVFQSTRIWKFSHNKMPTEKPVSVVIRLNIAPHHDIANREKGIMDALEDAAIIKNDSQVAKLVIEREESEIKTNEFTVEVTEI